MTGLPAALLVRGPPGVGKTTRTAKLVRQAIDGGTRVAVSVERVDLAWELDEMIARPNGHRVILGKRQLDQHGHPLCSRPSRLDELQAYGLQGLEAHLACRGCPVRDGCRYWVQFDHQGSFTFTSPLLRSAFFRGKMLQGVDLLVLDEGGMSAFRSETIVVTEKELEGACKVAPLEPLLQALDTNLGGREYLGRVLSRAKTTSKAPIASARARLRQLRNKLREHDRDRIASRSLGEIVHPKLIQLLQVLLAESTVKGPNSRLRVRAGKVEIRDPFFLDFAGKILVLDSTGEPSVYKQLLGREVQVVDPVAKCHAEVVQLIDGAYTQGSLDGSTLERLVELTRMIVQARGTPAHPVAVVVPKCVRSVVEAALSDEPAVVLHYAAVRGTNVVMEAEIADIVLLGALMPNTGELVAWAEARAWRDKEPIVGSMRRELTPFGAAGVDMAVPVLHFDDPRVDPWLRMGLEGELLQTAERIRSRLPTEELAEGKSDSFKELAHQRQIWLLTGIPVPGLQPDHLVTMKDF